MLNASIMSIIFKVPCLFMCKLQPGTCNELVEGVCKCTRPADQLSGYVALILWPFLLFYYMF